MSCYECPFRVVATDTALARWLQERCASLPPVAVRANEKELNGLFTTLRKRVTR